MSNPLPILLIFDLDGTLYQTGISFLPTMRAVYANYGLDAPEDDVLLSTVGEPFEHFLDWLVDQGLTRNRAELAQTIARHELESIRQNGALFPGAAETLRLLKEQGCLLAICTNGDRIYARAVLDHFGLTSLFDAIQTLEDNARTKADMINELRREFPHRRAWMIGDRYHDLRAGRDTGCTVVAAAYGYGSEKEMSSADYVLASITDLPGLALPANTDSPA